MAGPPRGTTKVISGYTYVSDGTQWVRQSPVAPRGAITVGTPDPNRAASSALDVRAKALSVLSAQQKLDEASRPLDLEAGRQRAAQLGIPYIPPRIPQGISTKKRDELLVTSAKRGEQDIAAFEEELKKSASLANTARQFANINARTATGPIRELQPSFTYGSDLNSMMTINQQLVPLLPRTPGAVSNFEAAGLQKGTLSPFNTKANNDAQVRRAVAYDQLNGEYAQFLNDWASVHGGSIDGARTKWQEYLRAQPIFDRKRPEMALPNKGRIDYRTFFRQKYYKPRNAAPGTIVEVRPEELE